MSSRLPEHIDPVRLAERGVRLVGELGLKRMTRLVAVIERGDEAAKVELIFAVAPQGRIRVTGNVAAHISMICQRCLEPVDLALEKAVNLVVVRNASEADMLPDEAEPLIYSEGSLSLAELVEDEFLLALPQEARHASGPCATQHVWHCGEPTLKSSVEKEANPFAVLEQLKRRN